MIKVAVPTHVIKKIQDARNANTSFFSSIITCIQYAEEDGPHHGSSTLPDHEALLDVPAKLDSLHKDKWTRILAIYRWQRTSSRCFQVPSTDGPHEAKYLPGSCLLYEEI